MRYAVLHAAHINLRYMIEMLNGNSVKPRNVMVINKRQEKITSL